ncbi:MAG: 30S ribosomal protein S4, partial [Planctomycetota bacterium]
HGARRRRRTDYGAHFREKQKVKRIYGLLETQFKRYFHEAQQQPGNTGENLLILLERRLDNIIFRGGLANSRACARQIIQQGHIQVNGHKISIPSSWLKAGDVIRPKPKEKNLNFVKLFREETKTKNQIPSWLQISDDPLELKVIQIPQRTDITAPINEQMVVEFCSR